MSLSSLTGFIGKHMALSEAMRGRGRVVKANLFDVGPSVAGLIETFVACDCTAHESVVSL